MNYTKLSLQTVLILNELAAASKTNREIATAYGVSEQRVSNIKTSNSETLEYLRANPLVDAVPTPQSVEELVMQYMDSLPLEQPCQVELEQLISNAHMDYEKRIAGSGDSTKINAQIKEEQDTVKRLQLQLRHFNTSHRLGAKQSFYSSKPLLFALHEMQDHLANGYSLLDTQDNRNYKHYSAQKGITKWVLERPQTEQDADKQVITKSVTELYTQLLEAKNNQIMNIENAQEYALAEHNRQLAEYDRAQGEKISQAIQLATRLTRENQQKAQQEEK